MPADIAYDNCVLRTFLKRLLALFALGACTTALIYVVWLDVWMLPNALLLLERRGTLHTGDVAACKKQGQLGTVLALGGEMLVAPNQMPVALEPGELALRNKAATVELTRESACLRVFDRVLF
jgi:uncharacterized RDD family membrane protein YckC